MKKSLISLLLIGTLLLPLVGCAPKQSGATPNTDPAAPKASAAAGETYVIKLGGSLQEDHPITMGLFEFKRLAEAYSEGRLEVQVYPNCQLGSNREFYEQCQSGNIQMAEAGAVILANFTNKFKFMQLPYLFNSREAVQNFLNSDMGLEMNKAIAEETGLYPLVYFENGWQALTNSKREVRTPEDMKGLKVRTQENDVLLKIYENLGANPMPMAFTELFTAMQQKTVDGQVNPTLVDQTGRYYEVQTYITDVNAVYDLDCISMNYEFYQSLPQDLQAVVDKASHEALAYQLDLSAKGELAAYDFLQEKGMKATFLTDEEKAAFEAAAEPTYEWFRGLGIEPKLDDYLAQIEISNQKYTDGKLTDVIGTEK